MLAALEATTVSVVSIADLIALKQAAGRAVDLSDVAALRALGDATGGGT